MGGSNIRVALCDGPSLIKTIVSPCPASGTEDVVLGQLYSMIDSLFSDQVTGIGIGVPSIVDTENGVVYDTVNIPSWKKVPLKALLTRRYNVRVEVANDANCFALGESIFGKGKGQDSVIGIVLGTGVGAGVVIGGKIYSGANFSAGEVGEMIYRDSNYENYCASAFFPAHYGTSAREAAVLARKGDSRMLQAWDEFSLHLSSLLLSVIYSFDPNMIVLGGGISDAFDLFGDKLLARLQECKFVNTKKNIRIEVSEIQGIAILGASALVL